MKHRECDIYMRASSTDLKADAIYLLSMLGSCKGES